MFAVQKKHLWGHADDQRPRAIYRVPFDPQTPQASVEAQESQAQLSANVVLAYRKARAQYVAKVRAAGSWAAYEKAHTARLVPVFEKIFPRPRLPHEIASHVVRFCFHTGDY